MQGGKKGVARRLCIGAAGVALLCVVAIPSWAVVPGSPSKFESNDGNMVVSTTGNNDWNSVDFEHVADLAQSTSDNSFTPGQKQDTTCPSIEGHKNPNKDDFTDVASYTETRGDDGTAYAKHVYLYGATIRVAANGNASENVELKQGTSGLCPGQPDDGLLARTPGDKLIAIDYLNGGTNVDFHVLTWVDSGACFVGNDVPPCWGATVLELSGVDAEGAVNQSTILAAANDINGQRLVAGKFAEFGIDLSGQSNIIPPGQCKAFPQTVWESRSSGSSFVSSTKDITIENSTISNCGRVIIHKQTAPRGDDQAFGFTSDLAGSEIDCSQTTATDFSLNDDGNSGTDNSDANTQDCLEVPGGSYSVSEDDPSGDNYALTSIDCSASVTTNGSIVTPDPDNRTVDFDLEAGDTVECTFTNAPVTGALSILKESTKTGNPLVANDGAKFCFDTSTGCTETTVTDDGTGDEDSTTGSLCVSGLTPGDYYVNETAPPTGYGDADATQADQKVTVVGGTDCGDNLPATGATATFTNPPLADIQVNFRDGGSGETSATIDCSMTPDSTTPNTDGNWDTSAEFDDLEPGQYTCTVDIDP
jgi:hypothetical protein